MLQCFRFLFFVPAIQLLYATHGSSIISNEKINIILS